MQVCHYKVCKDLGSFTWEITLLVNSYCSDVQMQSNCIFFFTSWNIYYLSLQIPKSLQKRDINGLFETFFMIQIKTWDISYDVLEIWSSNCTSRWHLYDCYEWSNCTLLSVKAFWEIQNSVYRKEHLKAIHCCKLEITKVVGDLKCG